MKRLTVVTLLVVGAACVSLVAGVAVATGSVNQVGTTTPANTSGQGSVAGTAVRNESNVTVPLNSSVLAGNCSVSASTRGNVSVPTLMSGTQVAETATVPAAWLVYTNRVDHVDRVVNRRLPEWVDDTSVVESTWITTSEETTIRGKSTQKVVVSVKPWAVNDVRAAVPRQIDCVEIAVKADWSIFGSDVTTQGEGTGNDLVSVALLGIVVAACAIAFVRWRRR